MRFLDHLLPLALALSLSACLENEEDIEVRADGSLHVRLTSRGAAADLAGGYPIPLSGAWDPVGDDTRLWLASLGPDTGSAAVRARVASGDWARAGDDAQRDVELSAQATFASADQLPRHYAPASAPYADAYLSRDTSLSIEQRGDKTVYTFERRFLTRDQRGGSLDDAAQARMPQALRERLAGGGPFDARDRRSICEAYSAAIADAAGRATRAALAEVYTAGDGSLSLEHFRRSVDRVVASVARCASPERLVAAWEASEQSETATGTGDEDPLPLLEAELRGAMRRELEALADENVEREIVNGILQRLEWLFTSIDHTDDLADETFTVKVRMPGTVITGNFDTLDGSQATFAFEGKELQRADVVLRLVSVVD